ncbi:SRPBCC domain-containing protein [Actinoplanes sp. NPDC048796]|uniref:SRPBCC domain-containing protein n=1 Tax=unclassified Actinoplanes TaxID=2626549 RepID=UPI0033F84D0C
MGKEYEIELDTTVDTDPEHVWNAIATGPGISSWYIGHTETDHDTVRTAFGTTTFPTATITANDPPHHFAYRTDTTPDGRFQAFEFLIEGHHQSATTLRAITSGFLPGDDWADEYEAMSHGVALFNATLTTYLNHFPGRTATPVTAFGPPITDWPTAWTTLHKTLGLTHQPRPGDHTGNGGEVYHASHHTLGIRTPTALHRYIRGYRGPMIAAHETFEPDPTNWTDFLTTLHTP